MTGERGLGIRSGLHGLLCSRQQYRFAGLVIVSRASAWPRLASYRGPDSLQVLFRVATGLLRVLHPASRLLLGTSTIILHWQGCVSETSRQPNTWHKILA